MANHNQPEMNIDLEIDRLVHEPVRLKILAYLAMVDSADFVFLVSRLGLTMGNLSAHISKLQDAGYIKIIKSFKDNRPHTMLSMTEKGTEAFSAYKEGMLSLLNH